MLATPQTLHEVVLTLFRHLPTYELLQRGVESLSEPLAGLWTALLHENSSPLARTRHKTAFRDEISSIWLTITNKLWSQGPTLLSSSLLLSLTPLLVATLTSDLPKLVDVTLNFWAETFDRQDSLTYPSKLCNAFQKCFQGSPRPHSLRLKGLEGVAMGVVLDKPGVGASAEEGVAEMETQGNSEEVVVIPHNSPLRTPQHAPRPHSSFLGRGAGQASPLRGRPHPLSPGSKALDRVLQMSSPSRPSPQGSGVHRRLNMSLEEDSVKVSSQT